MTISPPAWPETPVGERILGPNGVIATNLPGYEARRPQMEMADAVEQTLRDGGQALIEAGTGTGKSLAYLVPAIEKGERVVISTDTIQLQEQLVRKDLPFLETALGRPVRFAIAKGRGNYFCQRNTETFISEQSLIEPLKVNTARDLIREHAGGWDGDKATLTLPVADQDWGDLSGDESCTGLRCPHAATCAYLEAKRRFQEAEIVVTNHHYYLLHHYASRRTGGIIKLLPEHRLWIADEAHTLADKAQDVFGVEMGQGRPKNYALKVVKQAKSLDLDLEVDVSAVETAAVEFFDCFRMTAKDQQLLSEYPEEILAQARDRMEALVETLRPIKLQLAKAARDVAMDDTADRKRAVQNLQMTAQGIISDLKEFFEPPTRPCRACGGVGLDEDEEDCEKCKGTGEVIDPDPPVRYAELEMSRQKDGKRRVTLHAKPAETAPIFREIYDTLEAAVFCSATLAVGDGSGVWGPISDELGLNPVTIETFRARSPFDYAGQVRGYLPKTVPDSKHPQYLDLLAEEIAKLVAWTRGRAFILFTSTRDMREVRDRLWGKIEFPLFVQGEASKDLLIEQFKESGEGVLLGVKSFWTGVDIPGEALSCVALVKFPFPQPEHPLVKARCQRIEARGRKSFFEYSLPRAIRDIQQGFGRLIRSRRDRGLFVVFDSRMHTARYAELICQSLPAFPCDTELPTDWSLADGMVTSAAEAEEEREGAAHAPHGRAPESRGDRGAGEAGSSGQPLSPLRLDLGAMAQPDQPSPNGLSECGAGPTRLRARSADRRVEAPPLLPEGPARGSDGQRVGSGLLAASEALRPDAGNRGGPGAAGADGEALGAASPLWRYGRAWVEAIFLDRGTGVGPVCDGVTLPERAWFRDHWNAWYRQRLRVEERGAWCNENLDAPEWEARCEALNRSSRKLGELGDELAEWTRVPMAELWALLDECVGVKGE